MAWGADARGRGLDVTTDNETLLASHHPMKLLGVGIAVRLRRGSWSRLLGPPAERSHASGSNDHALEHAPHDRKLAVPRLALALPGGRYCLSHSIEA
jgi:hypothetical protein